jgi:2-polyprenyl-6-methoxyphenol hydroxylase-like FAD-dependent oxidoreductase
MNDAPMIDVLVVGAGPAGMTLTIDLARRGIVCRIIDRLPAAPVGTRARGVSPRSQEIFEDLFILEALSTYAEPALPWRIFDRDNRVAREVDAASTPNPALPPIPDAPYRGILQVS